MTTQHKELIRIGAEVIRHGRYIAIHLAEVAIPGVHFAEILRPIDALRPAP